MPDTLTPREIREMFAAVKGGHPFFQHVRRRIHQAGINIPKFS